MNCDDTRRGAILVAGGDGQVGRALAELRGGDSNSDYDIICAPKARLDLTRAPSIAQVIDEVRPQWVINAAAYTAVDCAEEDPDAAFAVNRDGAENLAKQCNDAGIPLLHLSTDYVFDGAANAPYREDAQPAPINRYGESKWAGEQAVRRACPRHIIVRTSGVFGAHGGNFVKTMVRLARQNKRLDVVGDQIICPTPAADLAAACVVIARRVLAESADKSRWGAYHYCSSEPVSWFQFAAAAIDARRAVEPLRAREIRAIATHEFPARAARPPYSALCCDKVRVAFGVANRSWRAGLNQLVAMKNLTDEK